MGFAYVEITGDLLTNMLTVGWQADCIECTEGLPEGALFQMAEYRPDTWSVRLYYSHPSFESETMREARSKHAVDVIFCETHGPWLLGLETE